MKAVFIGLVLLLGCVSIEQRVKPARFSYNDRMRNFLIIDRIPEYGDTKKDGCVIEEQIYLSLKTLDKTNFIGAVQDVETLDPLPGAIIHVHLSNTGQPLIVTADQNGKFSFDTETEIKKIDISLIGWRTLSIDFKRRPN